MALLKEENQLDKTKKYTILFVVICFIGIGVGGLLNQPSSSNHKVNKEETTQTVSIQVNEKETEEESQQTEKEENKEVKEITKQENKQTSNQTQQTETKEQSSSQKEQKTEESPKQEAIQEDPQNQVTISIQDINGIVANETLSINDGDTAYSVLKTLCNQKGISMSTKGYGKIIYVKEINGLSEFDYGNMSGWKYKVNGVYPNVGAGAYTLKDGDRVEWVYTTEG